MRACVSLQFFAVTHHHHHHLSSFADRIRGLGLSFVNRQHYRPNTTDRPVDPQR